MLCNLFGFNKASDKYNAYKVDYLAKPNDLNMNVIWKFMK